MALEIEGRRTVHVSGTASINAAGASTHLGDAEHQSLDTLMNVAAILNGPGRRPPAHHVGNAVLQEPRGLGGLGAGVELLGVPAFPKVCVLADVCRHDLLVEMEAVAVI